MEDYENLIYSFIFDFLRPSLEVMKILPPEIGINILKMLDSESLYSACQVNSHWLKLCRSDKTLRERIRYMIVLKVPAQPGSRSVIYDENAHSPNTLRAASPRSDISTPERRTSLSSPGSSTPRSSSCPNKIRQKRQSLGKTMRM